MDLQPAALIESFNKAPLQASMACLVSDIDMDTVDITTHSDKNYWESLYFHKKDLKKYLTNSKIPKIHPFPWLNVVPSLKKLCQAVLARNVLVNLQPTLNKVAQGSSFTILVTNCIQNLKKKKKWKEFFKDPESIFLKKWPISKRGLYRHVY